MNIDFSMSQQEIQERKEYDAKLRKTHEEQKKLQ